MTRRNQRPTESMPPAHPSLRVDRRVEPEAWPFPINLERLDDSVLAWAEQWLFNGLAREDVPRHWAVSERTRRRRVAGARQQISSMMTAEIVEGACVREIGPSASGRAYALKMYADLFLRPEPGESTSDFVYVCDRFRACLCATKDGTWPMVVHFGMTERNKSISLLDYGAILRDGGDASVIADQVYRLAPSFAAFHLALYWPSAAAYLSDVKESNPFLAGWLTAMTYVAAKKKRGSPYRGPSAFTAVRAWTIEGLRTCCDLSISRAMSVWNLWFPDFSYSEGTTGEKHYAKDRASVVGSMARMFGREFARLALSEQRRVDVACETYAVDDDLSSEITVSPEDDAKIWACLKKLGAVAEVTDVMTGRHYLARCTECGLPGCNCDVVFDPVD